LQVIAHSNVAAPASDSGWMSGLMEEPCEIDLPLGTVFF